jgi:amino acid permease
VVATYIGVALYAVLFLGYMIYERFCEGKTRHFVPSAEVDLASDAVWGPGQGDQIRAQDKKESEKKESSMKVAFSRVLQP